MRLILSLLVFLIILNFSCTYYSEESLYPETNLCDSTGVTYSGIIFPILENNCFPCHGSAVAIEKGGHLVLEGYSNIVDIKDIIRVAIRHESGAQPMPKDAAKLNDCQIRQFEIWLESGSPEN